MRIWQSEVDALAVRQTVTVTVLEAEHYDPLFPPTPLAAFLEWQRQTVALIPEEYHDTAEIEFESVESYYDSHYSKVEVRYRRPETDEEWAERKANVRSRLAALDAEKRRQYEALKREFDPTPTGETP